MRITVPANLLLLGEYAVLEEGGIGVTLAVEPRVTATLSESRHLELVGRWGDNRTARAGDTELFAGAVAAVAERLGRSEDELRGLPLRVEVDSTPFYDASGGKRGLGSSAATAVALCYALLDRAAVPIELPEAVFTCALRAHRAFQGGRGSGYDVAASVYGGIGRFEGGASPRYTPRTLPWLPPLTLFRGNAPVRTKDAVARYEAWKADRPRRAARFLEASNECVEGFLAAGSWTEAERWVEAARDLSIELGGEIGAPAAMAAPGGFEGISKATGAGNELGVAFGRLTDDREVASGFRSAAALTIAHRGAGREAGGSRSERDVGD